MITFTDLLSRTSSGYPIVAAKDVLGGYMSVDSLDELYSIHPKLWKTGMLVYVVNRKEFYINDAKSYDPSKPLSSTNHPWTIADMGSSNVVESYGIPILTKSLVDQYHPSKDYIQIRDYNDLDGEITNNNIPTSINGSYIDILFSAIRKLQSEVARLKNTFYYGIQSYTDGHTASSNVILDENKEESEPLWALDPEDLSEIDITLENVLTPESNILIEDSQIKILNFVSADLESTADYEEAKLVGYFIILPLENYTFKLHLTENFTFDLSNLNIQNTERWNVLLMCSRKIENVGKNYFWFSITNENGTLLKLGYLNENLEFSETEILLQKAYSFLNIELNNLILHKSGFYVKDLTFSNTGDIPSSLPDNEEFTFKAAHLTIRSVTTKEVLILIQNRLLNNELIWVENENTLYIKSNYNLISLSGGGINNENNMSAETILLTLIDANILTSNKDINSAKLNAISDLTFIHEDSGNVFKFNIDSQGNIKVNELNILKEATVPNKQYSYRGAVAYYTQNESSTFDGESALLSGIDINGNNFIYGDRVRISSWYSPVEDLEVFNCSHDFIELTNCSSVNYPLSDAILLIFKLPNGDDLSIDFYNLEGNINAGNTYLIRGKLRLSLDSPRANILVDNYDIELWKNKELVDLLNISAIGIFHKTFLEELVGKEGISINGNTINLLFKNSNKAFCIKVPKDTDTEYFKFNVNTNLIDIVALNKTVINYFTGADNSFKYLVESNYTNIANSIIKDLYFLDPAKLAFRSLTSTDETSNARLEKVASEIIPLEEKYLSFPNSDLKYPVSKFTPKASKFNKNICTDKTNLDYNKPNFVTCSFGINGLTTRCFNWVSVGNYDEYVWIREKSSEQWTYKFESYNIITTENILSNKYPRRKEFNVDINNIIYARMHGVFPGNEIPYVGHKVIVDLVENPVNIPTTYEYIVGKATKQGFPDLEHCSEIYEFTLNPENYIPIVFLTTDLLGFGWMEYLVWSAAAKEVLNKINIECVDGYYPVFINTGDMTLNGTRINEWLDYYNGGLPIFKKYEQMCVVGNNDLCDSRGHLYLGTGDDNGKSNPYYFHLFFCYEVDNEHFNLSELNWISPLICNNKYIPSTYYFYLGKYGYLMVNSELTIKACSTLFNLNDNGKTINIYTGYVYGDSQVSNRYCLKNSIESMLNKLQGKTIIAACHEMPFTVVNDNYLSNNEILKMTDRSLQLKNVNDPNKGYSLIGSHLNRIGADSGWNGDDNYWFSKLLESKDIKLCIGGHKHTYACTYPVKEGESSKDIIIYTGDTDGRLVDNYYKFKTTDELKGCVTYFMLQATGYKLKSSKELPSKNQLFSKIIPNTYWEGEAGKKTSTVDVSLEYPMYAVFKYNSDDIFIDLYRISNIKKETISGYIAKITEFSEINYSTNPMVSEKLLIYSNNTKMYNNHSLYNDNYWYTGNVNMLDSLRCYYNEGVHTIDTLGNSIKLSDSLPTCTISVKIS